MSNKFKLKKKLVSIALALVLAAQPLASLPMNVFAGTGENGMLTAPLKADLKELNPGQQIKSKYIVQKSVDFSDKKVLSGRIVQAPGIVYAKEEIDNSMRDVYIIANINGILLAAANAAAKAANAACYAAAADAADAAYAAYYAAYYAAAADAADAAYDAADAAAKAAGYATDVYGRYGDAADAAYDAAKADANAYADAYDKYNAWVKSYNSNVNNVVKQILEDYNAQKENASNQAWVVAAYAAVKAAKKMSDGKGLDLEAKLKIAHMAYRIAETAYKYNSSAGDKETKADEYKAKADALQKVIDSVYSDPVGDIAEQAAEA